MISSQEMIRSMASLETKCGNCAPMASLDPDLNRISADKKLLVRQLGRFQSGFNQALTQRGHLRFMDAHRRLTQGATIEAVEPALELPEHAMNEMRRRRRPSAVGVKCWIKLPIEPRGFVIVLLLQQTENVRHHRTVIFRIAGAGELHRRQLGERDHVVNDRAGYDDFPAKETITFNKAHDAGKSALSLDGHDVGATVDQTAKHGGFDIGGMKSAETPEVH